MASYETLARPYAKAIFQVASASQEELSQWSDALGVLEGVCAEDKIRSLLSWPLFSPAQKADQLIELTDQKNNPQVCNFLHLLAQNKRLLVIPSIRQIFEALKAQSETRIQVRVTSAFELDQEQRDGLAAALKKRFGQTVEMEERIDKSLLGGLIIHAGDIAIDGSLRGRLEQLAKELQ